MEQHSNNWMVVVSVGFIAAACHGSPARARQPALRPSAQSELPPPPSAQSELPLPEPSCTTSSTATDALPPVDSVPSAEGDDQPRLREGDVVFHVTNDTGTDVFIDETQPLVLELHGKLVPIDPGCGSQCPYCACKSCPSRPRQVRRIPDRGTWDYGWDRHIYLSQSCGGACPCIREANAQAGTYTVSLTGKRGASAVPAGSPLVYAGRPDEHSGDCVAKATFKLKPGAHVDLNLIASSGPHHTAPTEVTALPALDNSLRKRLGSDGSKRFEFLRSLCPVALQHNRNRWLVGCRVCPPFDNATPDGKAPEVGFDAGEFYELEGMTAGSFTRPGADEMAAVFAGCEAPDENRGGTLLAERRSDGLWISRSYKSGLHPDACVAFRRPDGRDLLVCRWADAHQGQGRAGILVQDFAATTATAGEAGWSNLVTLEDDAASVCIDLDATPTKVADSWVTTGRIDGFELVPAEGHTAGLVVHAHAARSRPTAAFVTRCRNWLHEKIKANPRYIDVRPGLNAPALRLVFLWTDNGFEPNAATKAILLQLDRASER